jgi:hypothetical protein
VPLVQALRAETTIDELLDTVEEVLDGREARRTRGPAQRRRDV